MRGPRRRDELSAKSGFKNRIRFYRELHGLTQCQLADYVGVSKNTLSSIECYEFYPSAFLAFKLCFALDVPFDELFYFANTGGSVVV